MKGEQMNKQWNLYVLRYNYSGNYYVGTTPDFENRMLIHWRRTSTNNNLPMWSKENKSINGFKYYWFKIHKEGVEQGQAEHCEDYLANLLAEKIKNLNQKVHVGNGKRIDTEDTHIMEIEVNGIEENLNNIDKEITDYLKSLKIINPPKVNEKLSIECCEIGCVGEYDHSQCNKSWSDVALIEFSIDKKEK